MANLFTALKQKLLGISNNPTIESGAPGTSLFHGILIEDFNSDLQFPKSIEVFEEMRKSDATVNATLDTVKKPILSAKWFFAPASEDEKDIASAEFATYAFMRRLKWAEILESILTYQDFGFYYAEKVFVIDKFDRKYPNHVFWARLAPRIQSAHYRWDIDGTEWEDGHPAGVTQQLPGKTDDVTPEKGNQPTIPWGKIILFSRKREGNNFEGVSVLRAAYKHWHYKEVLYRVSGISAERYGVGIPWAKLKAGASAATEAKIDELLDNLRSNEQSRARLNSDVEDWGILTPAGDPKAGAIQQLIDHHDRKIYDNILAGFLNLTTGDGGSNALSKDQSSFFLRSLMSEAEYIKNTLQPHIDELIRLNFPDLEDTPKLTCTDIGTISMDEVINSIVAAKGTGIINSIGADENAIREILKLPPIPPKDDDDLATEEMEAEMSALEMEMQGLEDDEQPQEEPEELEASEFIANFGESGEQIYQLVAKGENLPEEVKQKISEALKKGGNGELESDKDIQKAQGRKAQIQGVIDGFKAKLAEYKAKSAGMNRKAKKAFNTSMKTAVEAIKKQVQALKQGLKTQNAAIKARAKEVRFKQKLQKALDREASKQEKQTNKKDKKLAEEPLEPTRREQVFMRNINNYEKFLDGEFREFEKILVEFEEKYRKGLRAIYESSETERKDGVVSLVYDKKMVKKAEQFIDNLTDRFSQRIIESPTQRRLFNGTRKMAVETMESNYEYLAEDEVEIDEGQFRSFEAGYISNAKGVLFNEPRRMKEAVVLNYGSGVSIDLALKQADSMTFNRNIYKLSTITHARGAFQGVIYENAKKDGFTFYKVVVPSLRLADVDPSGRTAALLFTIGTAAMINKAVSKKTDGANSDAVKGLGIGHGTYEYYYPIESDKLDEEQKIARRQRKEFFEE